VGGSKEGWVTEYGEKKKVGLRTKSQKRKPLGRRKDITVVPRGKKSSQKEFNSQPLKTRGNKK